MVLPRSTAITLTILVYRAQVVPDLHFEKTKCVGDICELFDKEEFSDIRVRAEKKIIHVSRVR